MATVSSWAKRLADGLFGNKQLLILAFIFILVAGTFGMATAKREGFPEVSINVGIVSVIYPGAAPAQVEEQVVKPLEAAIAELKSVSEYEMSAGANGAFGSVTFKDGVAVGEAIRELNTKLARVSLPEGAEDPEVQEISASGTGDILLGVTGISDPWLLYARAKEVRDRLSEIKGVASVKILDGPTPTIRIDFDKDKLAALGLTREQVEGVIQGANVDLPIGIFINAQSEQVSVGLRKSLPDVTALQNLKIAGETRLYEVASVYPQLDTNDVYGWIGYREGEQIDSTFKRGPVITLAVDGREGDDLILVQEEIREEIVALENSGRSGERIVTIFSQADDTETQVAEIRAGVFGEPIEGWGPLGVIGYLFSGLGLIVLLLLIFVNWRVAVLAAISIPLSLLVGFAVLKLLGINLNTMVLFSMVLVIGLIVDPTIVLLEAMQRYKSQGFVGRELMAKTLSVVGVGVSLAVMTNFIVFIPFGVVSGFFGEIIRYIPLTVIPPIIASLVVPVLFILPIATRWLGTGKAIDKNVDPELVGVGRVAQKFGAMTRALLSPGRGKSVLRLVLVLVIASLPIVMAGAYMASGKIEFVQFSAAKDSDFMLVDASLPANWQHDRAVREVAAPVEKLLATQPEVKQVAYYQENGNSFTMLVNLWSAAERSEEDLRTAEELMEDLNLAFPKLAGVEVEASLSQAGPPADKYPVKIRIYDNDLDKLATATRSVAEFLGTQEGVIKVSDSLGVLEPQSGSLVLVADSDNPLAGNAMALWGAARSRLSEVDIAQWTLGSESFEVKSRLLPEVRSIDEITGLPVGPVGTIGDAVSRVVEEPASRIQRLNGSRYVQIQAKLDTDADPIAMQAELNEFLSEDKLAELGLRDTATESKGEADAIAKSFQDLFVALILAMFLIYVLLVGLMRSFVMPAIILFAVPLGLVAIFPALAATTGQLGFLELLGVVAMAGIVVNVTILIIDFANQMKREGLGVPEAMGLATAVRLRPILLTKATIVGGLLPLMIYSPFWKGLAIVLASGVAVSGFLSLMLTPILFLWADAAAKGWRRKKAAKATAMAEPVPVYSPLAGLPVEPAAVAPIQPQVQQVVEPVMPPQPVMTEPIVSEPAAAEPTAPAQPLATEAPRPSADTTPSENEIKELLARIIENRQ